MCILMHLIMTSKSPVTSSDSPDAIVVKKEVQEDENIKEFAETAMNELLGWYGYESRAAKAASAMAASGRGSPSVASSNRKTTTNSPHREDTDECAWCNNPVTESNGLHQSMGDKFCSELCFSQSRRATFKRAKTCDWCRHVRHTVSYVDFQDGATQLQFCSDKCLNQYKMHIFCRETQAHLDLNPHLVNAATSNTNLITPDLWMKNCKSRSVSPNSERSVSPTAENIAPINKTTSPKLTIEMTAAPLALQNTTQPTLKSAMPIITVAPSSKLMKAKPPSLDERLLPTTSEMRREQRIMKANNKRRRSSRCSSTVTSQTFQKHNATSTITKPQDLRVNSPTSSLESTSNASLLQQTQNLIPSPPLPMNPRLPNMHSYPNPNPLLNMQPPFLGPGQSNFQDPRLLRPPFFPPQNFMPRPQHNMFANEPLRPPSQHFGVGPPPPVTILVPYPVLLPIPLPIPIPIPIPDFVRAFQSKKWTNENKADPDESTSEEPLDFTINQKKTNHETEHLDTRLNEKKSPSEKSNTKDNVDAESSATDSLNNNEVKPSAESSNLEQTLPRFKITRLGAKMSKVVIPKVKDVQECTRPLRKRRRPVEEPLEEENNPVVSKTRKTVHA